MVRRVARINKISCSFLRTIEERHLPLAGVYKDVIECKVARTIFPSYSFVFRLFFVYLCSLHDVTRLLSTTES